MADAARPDLFGERLPELGVVEGLVRAGVELVEVDVIGSERFERGVELAEDLVGRPQLIALEVAEVAMPELGGDEPLLATALDGLADQPFGDVVAVALRRVEEVDAEFASTAKQLVRRLRSLVPPMIEGPVTPNSKMPSRRQRGWSTAAEWSASRRWPVSCMKVWPTVSRV
jgi:hypothetical protein